MNKFASKILKTTPIVRAAGAVLTVALISASFVSYENTERAANIAATAAFAESTGLHAEQLPVYARIAKTVADHHAAETLAEATTIIAAVHTKIDSKPLTSAVASLGEYKKLDIDTVLALTDKAKDVAENAVAAAAEVDRVAAVKAAAVAAAAKAARVARAKRDANTPAGAKATARTILSSRYGWGADQFSCLDRLWQKESEWKVSAQNNGFSRSSAHVPDKQAYGIAQAGPGSRMGAVGGDWRTNAATQIVWGLTYIKDRYGSPCGAWSHSVANNWY